MLVPFRLFLLFRGALDIQLRLGLSDKISLSIMGILLAAHYLDNAKLKPCIAELSDSQL